MKIEVLNSIYDLKKEPKIYYLLLYNLFGNWIGSIIGYIQWYDLDKNEKYLEYAEKNARLHHPKFVDIIDDVLVIMNKEEIRGRLLTLVKRLRKASNFDWTNLDKFRRFYVVYDKILKQIKKLS
jgi:hypothetical protein